MTAVLVVHGPNLNLLGRREPEIYGSTTLEQIDAGLARLAAERGIELTCFQSNAEHELVESIQRSADEGVDWIVINPAGLTHTSVVLRDALAAVGLPFIEVHLSNPHAREPFRHRSLVSDLAVGTVAGFGAESYRLALEAVAQRTQSPG